jgi:type I restriction enzyme S subunit
MSTPAGPPSADWPSVTLGELATNVTKGESIQWQGEAYQASGIPFIRTVNVQPHGLDLSDVAFVSPESHARMTRSQLRANDLLISIAGTLGRSCIVPAGCVPANINQDVALVRIQRDDIHLPYVLWALRSDLVGRQIDRIGRGAGRIHLNLQQVRSLGFPQPPLPEQRRIAALLDKADVIRRKRQQAIRLADDLLSSAFLDMFGDPVTNPKGWHLVNAGELFVRLDYGTSEKCSVTPSASALPVLRIPNVANGKVSFEELKYATLQEAEARKLRLADGDLLFVRTNGNPDFIGRCAVFEGDVATMLFASYLIRGRLRAGCGYRSRFLRDVVSAPTYRSRLVREARTTAGNYNISAEGLRRLPLIVPPIADQDRYLRLASRVAATHDRLADASAGSTDLFHAVVRRAFRGEV